MFFGLDISTTITGWSLLDNDGNVIKSGYVKFPKSLGTDLFDKMDYFEKEITPIIKQHKKDIKFWGVEEAAKKFQQGKSSARTIFTCASFNFGVTRSVQKILKKKPIYIPSSSARKMVSLKIPKEQNGKLLDKKDKKSYIVDWCKEKYPNLVWNLTRNGTYKPYCFDVADSLVVAEAIRLSNESNISTARRNS